MLNFSKNTKIKVNLFDTSFDFLLKPIFLHGFSAALHMVLLLFFLVSLVVNRVKEAGEEGSKETLRQRKVSWHKQTLGCCFAVSAFNIYGNVWSEDKLVTLSDYVLKILVWGAMCVYLHCQFSNYGEQKRFPFLLRICLVVDIVDLKKHASFPSQYLVSDVFSVITGFFLNIVAFFPRNEGEDALLEEPLLSGDSSVSNGVELSKKRGGDTVTPYSNAGIFSILTFSWMGPSIATGNKKTLDLEDVPQLDSRDSVVGAFPKFRNRLEATDGEGTEVTTLKLVKALFFSVWKDILWTGLFVFMYTVASYVGPYLIDTFVQYLNGQRVFKNEGYLLVTAFFVAKLVECTSQRWWFFKLQQVGIRLRAVLIAMICNKGLTVSCQSKQSQTSGEIINYMTVDAERVGDFSWYMHDLWMVALQLFGFFPTTLALLILYKNLRLAAIAAFVTTILVMLANIPLGKMLEKFQDKLMKSKDERMKATFEILRNMRIFKLQGWEMKFLSKIIGLRSVEEGWLKRFVYTNAMTSFLFWIAPSFVSVATFGACILLGIPLESEKILSALATFRILQEPIYNLPDTISMIVQTKVSLDRIATFLRLDDLQPDAMEKLPRGSSNIAIEIVDGNFSWDLASSSPTLKDINLKVFHGMRVAVCGTVGSGKSSLLSKLFKFYGTKAYVAQSPWIQSGKIEENILFGKAMDRERYDQTVIGERGINLSGGQKQRIQIARALYQDADIYLFDDPFSTVDAHTGSYLFKEVLLGILSSKTLIYVTHQVEFLPAADLILVMKNGRITQAGKYNDILNSSADFMELVGAHKKALSALDTVEVGSVSEKRVSEGDGASGSASGEMLKEGNENSKASTDQSVVDLTMPLLVGAFAFSVIQLLGIIVVISQVAWQIFIIFIPVIGTCIWYQQYYISSARELGRLVGVCKAPVIQSFSETILGATTIRSFDQESRFQQKNMELMDAYSRPKFYVAGAREWLCFRLDMLSSITFAFSLFFLISIPKGIIDPAIAAWVVWNICSMENRIISVERILQYSGIPREPALPGHWCKCFQVVQTIFLAESFDYKPGLQFVQAHISILLGSIDPHYSNNLPLGWSRNQFPCLVLLNHGNFINHCLFPAFISFSFFKTAWLHYGNLSPFINFSQRSSASDWHVINVHIRTIFFRHCSINHKFFRDSFRFILVPIPTSLLIKHCISAHLDFVVIETNRPDRSWPFCGEVHIHDLQVRYASHMPLVLRGLTCTFPGGLKTGIVGRTGSGKTTLIQTLF
ncbi:hypothetical protein V6Z11_A13G157100 [Gossypium hirsutum]